MTSRRWAFLAGGSRSYPLWQRMMEVSGIGAYGLAFVVLTFRVISQGRELAHSGMAATVWIAIIGVTVLALFCADFVSGFVHCAADNFGSTATPIFGPAFINPFREHHRDPEGITHHDFIETNGNSCLVCLLALLPVHWLVPEGANLWAFGTLAFTLVFTSAILLTNQFHKWAHMAEPPSLALVLQRTRLILSPEQHALHHTPPYNRNYCITTGWMNAPIERSGVFNWLVRTCK